MLICTLIVITTLTANAQTAANTPPAETPVKWYTLEEAQALSAKAPRKIFVDMYTSWCGWCKVMDKNTFSQPEIAQYLNTYFYPVKFDGEGKEPVVFNGQTFNYNPDYRCHELAAAIMQGNMSYPTTVYINEQMQLLTLVPGYLLPDDLLPILVFFAQDYFQKMSWPDFQQQWPQIKETMQKKK